MSKKSENAAENGLKIQQQTPQRENLRVKRAFRGLLKCCFSSTGDSRSSASFTETCRTAMFGCEAPRQRPALHIHPL